MMGNEKEHWPEECISIPEALGCAASIRPGGWKCSLERCLEGTLDIFLLMLGDMPYTTEHRSHPEFKDF